MTDLLALLREAHEQLKNYRADFPADPSEFVDNSDPLQDLINRIDTALSEHEAVSKIGWCGDRSGTPFGPSDAGPEDERAAEPERKCKNCWHWLEEQCWSMGPVKQCGPEFGCILWRNKAKGGAA